MGDRTIKQKQVTSGWADKSVSQEALDLIGKLPNANKIEAQLRVLLERYRLAAEMRKTEPQDSAAKGHMTRLVKQAQALMDGLEVLPARERAILQTLVFRATGEGFPFNQLQSDLTTLAVVSQKMAAQMPSRGRGDKAKKLEVSLLSSTSALIEKNCPDIGLTESANLASDILISAGVSRKVGNKQTHLPERPAHPEDTSKPRELVRKWRKNNP